MKKISILIVLVLLHISCIGYKYIPVQIDSIKKEITSELSKDQLWVKSNNWMVQTFNSAESVIEFSDKEAGVINGRYILKVIPGSSSNIMAAIVVQVLENKVVINVDPNDFSEIESKSRLYDSIKYTEEQALKDVNEIISSFEYYIQNNKTLGY